MVRLLTLGYLGLRFGSGIGFFAALLVVSGFNFLIILVLAFNLSIIALLGALVLRKRRLVNLRTRSLVEGGVGFSAGVIGVFVAILYYFWLGILALVVAGVASFMSVLIGARGSKNQASAEVHRLVRNLSIVIAVMAPMLFLVLLVIRGLLPIISWAIAYSAFSAVLIAKYIRDRRQSRASL